MWCENPIHTRAPKGGEVDPLDGRLYRGGEFEPFYVPRLVMPQVDEIDLPDLYEFLSGQGITVELHTYAPSALRAHQRVDMGHVHGMPPEVLAKPLLTSADRFVLDGNHRWWAHKELGVPVSVREIQLPFEPAIAALFSFPKTYSYGDGNDHSRIQN